MTRGIISRPNDGILRGVTTSDSKPLHTHSFEINDEGFGQTLPGSDGHVHGIMSWTVLPAGPGDHEHEIDKNATKNRANRGRYRVIGEEKR